MNRYRVDRSLNEKSCPCGMNSLRYLGESLKSATEVFDTLEAKGSMDGKGVILSMYDEEKREYVVKRSKGF